MFSGQSDLPLDSINLSDSATDGLIVMHYIDNFVALSAVVKGYASKADCAILVNCLHEAVLELRTQHLWAEWIPSKANPDDWPTRPELEHLIPSTAVFIPMVLPSVDRIVGGEIHAIAVSRNTKIIHIKSTFFCAGLFSSRQNLSYSVSTSHENGFMAF